MKRSVGVWQLMGFAVTSLLGTILHFLYDWLGGSVLSAPFSGVNESTWEHMKLMFWPMFFYALFERAFFKKRSDFWCIKLRGLIVGLFLIPILFYSYNGIIGPSPDLINIAIFFVAAAIAYVYETKLFDRNETKCHIPYVALFLICIVAVLFIAFTFAPPTIGLFRDPITKDYGIVQNSIVSGAFPKDENVAEAFFI